jgi:hypothetical protein
MSENDIVRIPLPRGKLPDRLMGSCPECGKNIWASYFLKHDNSTGKVILVFECIECKQEIKEMDIIPF